MMTAKQILIDGLKAMGADGLVNGEIDSEGCGCGIDDLAPCCCCLDGWMNLDDCKAAKLNKEDGLYYLMEEQ